MSKSECIYDLPLTPDEVRSLASAVSYPFEGDNESAQASDTLRRKATALLAYVEAEALCWRSRRKWRVALLQQRNPFRAAKSGNFERY